MISGAEVLVVCTANICRSPMAGALLSQRLARSGLNATVRSAGMLGDGNPPCPEVVAVMADYGLDVSAHRSRQMTAEDLERADLILAMARENLRYAAVTAPPTWPQSFTLRELVRRGMAIGPRSRGESMASWLSRAHEGRERAALLGDSPEDDVADPAGRSQRAYAETAAVLSELIDRLVALCWLDSVPQYGR
jgi:protein-tyrosine phosphatase